MLTLLATMFSTAHLVLYCLMRIIVTTQLAYGTINKTNALSIGNLRFLVANWINGAADSTQIVHCIYNWRWKWSQWSGVLYKVH